MKRKPNDLVTNINLPSIDGTTFNLDELNENFTIVAIFDSHLGTLRRNAKKHHAPFPILADETNKYYKEYGVERSFVGMLKGMFGRPVTLLNAMFVKGYIPLISKGNWLTMPVDILVDEKSVIKTAHYGKDEGDHLAFNKIKEFSFRE